MPSRPFQQTGCWLLEQDGALLVRAAAPGASVRVGAAMAAVRTMKMEVNCILGGLGE